MRLVLPIFTLVLVAQAASVARADELADFDAAQQAYEQGNYALAVERFEAMVGGATPAIRSEILVLESRKFLAASYLFVDRPQDAEVQFERLLAQQPDYALDPVAFPAAVHESFRTVQARVRATQVAETAAEEEAQRRRREDALQRLLEQQQRIARLEALASEERVEERGSRWLAMVPFGVGQFQNGHRGLAIALMTAQIFFAATSTVTYFYHGFLEREAASMGTEIDPDLQSLGQATRIINQVSLGLLGATVAAGVIDAQVRFRGNRTTVRHRPLPDDLRDLDVIEEQPAASLRLQIGAGYAGFHLSF